MSSFLSSHEFYAVIAAAAISAFSWLVLYIITPRAKVIWSISHQKFFLMKSAEGDPFRVFTRQLWLQNLGRKTADGVEIALNYAPLHFEISPPIRYSAHENPDQRYIIRFEHLSGREFVIVDFISSNIELPNVASIRWNGGTATPIAMAPQRLWPVAFQRVVLFIMIAGVFCLAYLLVRLLQFAVG